MTDPEAKIKYLNTAHHTLIQAGSHMSRVHTIEAQQIWWHISHQMSDLQSYINTLAKEADVDPDRPDLNPE